MIEELHQIIEECQDPAAKYKLGVLYAKMILIKTTELFYLNQL